MSVFLAKTKPDGTLDFGSPYNAARFRQFCKDNKWVRIEKPKVLRTLSQNALYWVFLEQICYETGNEADDLHEFFKSRLLPKKLITIHGKKGDYDIERVKSTTELTKLEFGEYMDKISAMTGVAIPVTEAWKEANGYLPG